MSPAFNYGEQNRNHLISLWILDFEHFACHRIGVAVAKLRRTN